MVNRKAAKKRELAANDDVIADTSPKSLEVVIALVGYAGAGCTEIANKLEISLKSKGYEPKRVKLSKIIQELSESDIPTVSTDQTKIGIDSLNRAIELQNQGDILREKHSPDIIVRKAIETFQEFRDNQEVGQSRIAFILDSVKHLDEIELLRELYGPSFRLLAVHCSKPIRFKRLHGELYSDAKFRGSDEAKVESFMNRDEKDKNKNPFGQQVRDAFYLGDYFLDNDHENDETDKIKVINDIDRFTDLLLGKRLFRPTREESGIYHAFSASRHSACLSRQVGASLHTADGRIISNGANEVPMFGGGVYGEDTGGDEKRCFGWEFSKGDLIFTGCHNTRKKREIKDDIANWLTNEFFNNIANKLSEDNNDFDKNNFLLQIKKGIEINKNELENAPGIGQLIEFSRSIHAEMDAILTASRSGHSTKNTILYCTTYPCHNCARHLVTAGVKQVVYVEPYVKSLALELHSDSLTDQKDRNESEDKAQTKMLIKAFTGVGPRMFDLHFKKTRELKNDDGTYIEPTGDKPVEAVRIETLRKNEIRATKNLKNLK